MPLPPHHHLFRFCCQSRQVFCTVLVPAFTGCHGNECRCCQKPVMLWQLGLPSCISLFISLLQLRAADVGKAVSVLCLAAIYRHCHEERAFLDLSIRLLWYCWFREDEGHLALTVCPSYSECFPFVMQKLWTVRRQTSESRSSSSVCVSVSCDVVRSPWRRLTVRNVLLQSAFVCRNQGDDLQKILGKILSLS